MTDVADDLITHPEPGENAAQTPPARRLPWVFAGWLILAGVIGWWAAFQLTLEKFHTLTNPDEALSCDFNPIFQCMANLNSPQGAIFGFPNPILGLAGWMAPIIVGASLLAGARFARWYWITFNLGVAGALALVIWLISQSVYVIGTLCPWCMVTWAVTIPTFLAVTFRNLGAGVFTANPHATAVGRTLLAWTAPISILCYLLILVLAQLRLDFITRVF